MKMKKYILTVFTACIVSTSFTLLAEAPGILPGMADYESQRQRPQAPLMMTFMPGGEQYLLLASDFKSIIKYDTATGRQLETILDVSHTRENTIPSIQGFTLSPDGTKLLIYAESKPIYRYSFAASYYVFDIRSNILKPLSKNHALQRNPVFSPDARCVAFVADNNIYLSKLDFNTETAVTTDGELNAVINGAPDWGYDEEFDMTSAMAWDPDGTTLVYLKFDERRVPLYSFPLYAGYSPSNTDYILYPGTFSYKYAMPGEPNAKVTLHSYNIDNRDTKNITLPDASIEYIPRLVFAPSTDNCILLVPALNRDQTRMELYAVNPKSTVVKSLFVEQPGAWVIPETYENLKPLANSFVIMSPRSGYTHLYEYSYNGALLRTITSGDFDVTDYYGADAKGNHYYCAASTGPINRVVSRIDQKNKITDISPDKGVASAVFAPECNFFLLNESNVSQAPVYTLCNNNLKRLRVMEDNSAVTARYAAMPRREFVKVPSAAPGIELDAYIIKPADFNPSRRYPLIVWQYSGPGAASVLDTWSVGWEQYAAACQGYIVACVDPRGSAGHGYSFLTAGYRHLGLYETQDQCAAARHFASLPYIDESRIGIAGWSYGGYETLMALSAYDTPFAAGVAVAPVTSWRYYDSIYSERFMLTPQQNPDGYDSSAPVNNTSSMNAPLLIMSGTSDDNVHFVNSVNYISQLLEKGKLCNLMVFPGKNHSIFGGNSRELVYSNMLNHFNNYLK